MSTIDQFLSPNVAAQRQALRQRILNVTDATFDALALDVFHYQAEHNVVYATYLKALGVRPANVSRVLGIPFMPISFFRQHRIQTGVGPATLTFASSGTTGAATSGMPAPAYRPSTHYVADADLYNAVSRRAFEERYGPLTDYHILALLPSYLERNNSSLVYMVQQFITHSQSTESGFFLHDLEALTARLRTLLAEDSRKLLLIGVTFALLDWVETLRSESPFRNADRLVVMETGGMKGRRKELLREEVHDILTETLRLPAIHSEYGMTELLSQAYSTGAGVFHPAPTMRVLLRDVNDPFCLFEERSVSRTGGINVVDLANLDSCAFIETQDLGQYVEEEPGAFRVMGRFDNSDLRGCNLMVV